MEQLKHYTFKGFPFRMLTLDNGRWFVGMDVLQALGYSPRIKTSSFYHKLTAEQQGHAPCHLLGKTCGRASKIISEAGVRVLITRCFTGGSKEEFIAFFNGIVGLPSVPEKIAGPESAADHQCFNFGSNQIRVIEQEGEPWFVAKDVCKAIGYAVKGDGNVNTTNAVSILDFDEVMTANISGSHGIQPKLISESGLYKLILRSKKPEAKRFQDWVTRDVLPTIRKTGSYNKHEVTTPQTAPGLSDDAIISRAIEILQTRSNRLEAENTLLRQKADAYDRVMELMGNAQPTIALV